MTEFKRITPGLLASGQITPDDVSAAREHGVTLIINNRPDEEEPGQPTGASIEDAAREAGIAYTAIPVGSGGFSLPQVDAMAEAIAGADGETLAFCRTGTRSTLLWALTQAKQGRDTDAIAADAAAAGYSVDPVRPTLDMLSAGAGKD